SEAASEHFYERGTGHLVVISSVPAMRGMPGSMATYAATKAAVAHLAEGIRSDLLGRRGHDIAVATVYPGYIASEMNADVEQKLRLMVETETGCRRSWRPSTARSQAVVPAWPWRPVSAVLRHAPLSVVRRLV
ncbi:MAG: SDR family NAD(P)-dependent oxidoreductase, partial [Nocardioidaceae bacterium]|nr:SDR family NAD(P)-dependent oxidoreductase [Nocardioidaceae bacterium]